MTLRENGVTSIAEVRLARMEADGQVSVIKKEPDGEPEKKRERSGA